MTARLVERLRAGAGPELRRSPRFERRLRRLIAVSAVALGAVALLAVLLDAPGNVAVGLLVAGWIAMPVLLAAAIGRPALRYLLTVPATLVGAGLVAAALAGGSRLAAAGWWTVLAGIGLGAMLGGWFWYRMVPVPERLSDPFAAGRWALITVHVALVVAGCALLTWAWLR